MTPAQCRAARALISMTQPMLAMKAAISLTTVVDFEKDRRQVSEDSVKKIERAFENAGVEFISENGGGAGVRLKRKNNAE